jgi:hypothetical protein
MEKEVSMYLIREVFHCRPGKVRPLIEKFKAMSSLMEKMGTGKMRLMTDVSGERYWTLVAEMDVESLDRFMKMEPNADEAKEFEAVMKDYHDLVDDGHREIYKIEL